MHPSTGRYKRTTSASLITVRQAKRETFLLGNARAVAVVGTHIQTGGRHSSITDAVGAEKYTAETGETGTSRIGGRADTMEKSEETVLVAKVMVKHPTSHTPNTDSGNSSVNMPTATEVGRLEV